MKSTYINYPISKNSFYSLLVFLIIGSCAPNQNSTDLVTSNFQIKLPENWTVFQKDVPILIKEASVIETATGYSKNGENVSLRISVVSDGDSETLEKIKTNWTDSKQDLKQTVSGDSGLTGKMSEYILSVYDEDIRSERAYYIIEWLLFDKSSIYIVKYGSYYKPLYDKKKGEILESVATLKRIGSNVK